MTVIPTKENTISMTVFCSVYYIFAIVMTNLQKTILHFIVVATKICLDINNDKIFKYLHLRKT